MVAIGVTREGEKKVVGMWIEPSESTAKREDKLLSLRARGLGSPLLFVTDGLQGMPEAIGRVFPLAKHQRCWVHALRNMTGGARGKDAEEIAADAREVYTQPSRELAEERMAAFIAKWGKAYPSFRKYAGFKGLFEFYSLPRPLSKSTYTSNVIEGFNSKFKRETAQRNNLNSLENASAVLIAVADSYNRSRKVKRITGYYEMTEGELEKARMAR